MNFIKAWIARRRQATKNQEEQKQRQEEQRRATHLEQTRADIKTHSEKVWAEKNKNRLARLQEFSELLSSGEAIELRGGQIIFIENPCMEFLMTLEDLTVLRNAMKSNSKEVVEIRNWSSTDYGPPSHTLVRPETICSISEYKRGRWILLGDHMVFHVSQGDVEFFEKERGVVLPHNKARG